MSAIGHNDALVVRDYMDIEEEGLLIKPLSIPWSGPSLAEVISTSGLS